MKDSLLVEVLVDYDPDRDQPKNPYHCPISHALLEDPDITKVFTTYDYIAFTRISERRRYYVRMPAEGKRFIRTLHRYYDRLVKRRPALFRLRLWKSDIIDTYFLGLYPNRDEIAPGPPIVRAPVNRSVRSIPEAA